MGGERLKLHEIQAIKELFQAGASRAEIASKIGRSQQGVGAVIRKMNITRAPETVLKPATPAHMLTSSDIVNAIADLVITRLQQKFWLNPKQ